MSSLLHVPILFNGFVLLIYFAYFRPLLCLLYDGCLGSGIGDCLRHLYFPTLASSTPFLLDAGAPALLTSRSPGTKWGISEMKQGWYGHVQRE